MEKKEEKDIKNEEQVKEIKKEDNKEVKKEEKKKDNKVKGENKKKSKKGLIIAISVIVVVVALISFATYMLVSFINSPKTMLEATLTELKSGDTTQQMLASLLEEQNFDENTQKLFFERLEWNILSVEEEGDTATVEIEITNKDFKAIIGNYMQRIIKAAFSGEELKEEDIANYLIEELGNSEIQNVTTVQNVVLEKQDNQWKIKDKNNFASILLPGFNEALEAYN